MKYAACAAIGLSIFLAMTGVTILVYTVENKEKIMKILAIAALAIFASAAHAQETLDYTGQAMTGAYSGGFTLVEPTLDLTSISGDIVLAQALNPNAANQIVTPLSYNFGTPLLNSTLGYVDAASFSFSTQNGNVTAWSISLRADTTEAGSTLVSTSAGDQYSANIISNICFHGSPSACSSYSASNTQGGVWVDPPTKSNVRAPELDSSTAASALVLLLGGVAIMRKRV